MNEQVLARFHRYLVDALRRTRPDPFGRPVTVSEIYQDLVPYREARTALGVDLNADYEQTLLGLLAGIGDRARLEPESVREQLRRELESPNPNVTIYRGFAACDVWISPLPPSEIDAPAGARDAPAAIAGTDDGLALGEPWEPVDYHEAATPPEVRSTPPSPSSNPAANPSPPMTGESMRQWRCAFCNDPLPAGRDVNFCPSCGADQRLRPCASCGEAMEPEWRFCIRCGAAVNA
jgi:Double zinc ribbon